MLLGQVLQDRLVHARGLDERRVGLDDDVALSQPLDHVLSGAPGVNLVLANIDLTTDSTVDVRLELVQVLDAVVGDTDGADLSGLLRLQESSPGALAVLLRAARGVDEDPASSRQQSWMVIRISRQQKRNRTGQCSRSWRPSETTRWRPWTSRIPPR